jgi:ribosomal protein S18 acetylase RimI-like enzyme
LADFDIRQAVHSDIDALWLILYYASWSQHQDGVTPDDIRRDPYLTRYVRDWGRPGDMGVIGETSGHLVGAAWVRLLVGDEQRDISFVDPETPELAVAVLPGQEGRGRGTALMEALLRRAREEYPGIVLTVREANPAVRLYERLGFETIDRVVNRVGTASLKMLLRL